MQRILVVDDKWEGREPIARLLRQEGYEVFSAKDAHEAMGAARQHDPDLIILDVMIPPMDGLTLLFLMREEPRFAEVPVIMMSGLSDERTIERARELGAKEFLLKARFTPEDMIEHVRRHARKRPA